MVMMPSTAVRPIFFHACAAVPAAAWSPLRRPGSIFERRRKQAEGRYRVGVAPLSEPLNAAVLWAEAARQDALSRHAPLRAVALLKRGTGVPLRGALP